MSSAIAASFCALQVGRQEPQSLLCRYKFFGLNKPALIPSPKEESEPVAEKGVGGLLTCG